MYCLYITYAHNDGFVNVPQSKNQFAKANQFAFKAEEEQLSSKARTLFGFLYKCFYLRNEKEMYQNKKIYPSNNFYQATCLFFPKMRFPLFATFFKNFGYANFKDFPAEIKLTILQACEFPLSTLLHQLESQTKLLLL